MQQHRWTQGFTWKNQMGKTKGWDWSSEGVSLCRN